MRPPDGCRSMRSTQSAWLSLTAPLCTPQVFRCPPSFRVFAAQNPVREGGGRKGLPRSFLNRFTRVAVEAMETSDLEAVRFLSFPPTVTSAATAPKPLLSTLEQLAKLRTLYRSAPLERTFWGCCTRCTRQTPWSFATCAHLPYFGATADALC